MNSSETYLDEIKQKYAEKFAAEEEIFRHIHRGDRIWAPDVANLNISFVL